MAGRFVDDATVTPSGQYLVVNILCILELVIMEADFSVCEAAWFYRLYKRCFLCVAA